MMSVHGQHPERERKLTLESHTLHFDNVGHWIVSTPAGKDGKPFGHNCKKCSIDGLKDAITIYVLVDQVEVRQNQIEGNIFIFLPF